MKHFTSIPALFFISQMSGFGGTFFQSDLSSGVGWGQNASSTDVAATFGYDYSADDIAEAPNSGVGDPATRGLKMEANLINPADTATVIVYPVGQSFTGNYTLRFDA